VALPARVFTHAGNPRIVLQHEAFGLASPHTVYNIMATVTPQCCSVLDRARRVHQ
jgi:hypothetical protein